MQEDLENQLCLLLPYACSFQILLLSHKQLETIYVNFLHTLFMNIAEVMHML